MRLTNNPILRSLLVHGVIAALIVFKISNDPPQVRGGAGLAGRTQTHFDVTVSQPKESFSEKTTALPIREGLPTEVKNPKPREIERSNPTQREEVKSAGTSDSAPAGNQGQAGSSATVAAELGNSDRSNAEGIYLQKLQRKIQENLESPGFVDFDRKTILQFLVRSNGGIEKVMVLRSSGDPSLDRKAIQAVQKVKTFLERPNDLPVQVPVVFRATR